MHVCNLTLDCIAHHRFDQWLFNGSTDGIKSNHTNYFKPCFSVSGVVLCIQKDIFWIALAMQHETLCAEHISVRYPRAGASLNTSHKPFTTWWGKLLPRQSPSHCLSSIIACLDTKRWKGWWMSPRIISVYFPLLHFLLLISCAESNSSINQFTSLGFDWKAHICNMWKFTFFLREHIKLCQF